LFQLYLVIRNSRLYRRAKYEQYFGFTVGRN